MKVTILGSGTSSGVPRIGNDWGTCDPKEPKNRRTRASILAEYNQTRILVDTSPDMRAQLLAADVGVVDAVIWTHEHADHVFGIDDLRQIYHALGHPVAGYARASTLRDLQEKFPYAFRGRDGYPPTVELRLLPDNFTIGEITVSAVDQPHASITSAGLRFEAGGAAIGYATDFSEMTRAMRTNYARLDAWIVDALRRKPHPSHPHLARVIAWAAELGPARTALVHMDQSMDYRTLRGELPKGIEPGFDGMEIEV